MPMPVLCLSSHQVKVLSAECLHATVLYMVGKSANESDSASATSAAAKSYAQVRERGLKV